MLTRSTSTIKPIVGSLISSAPAGPIITFVNKLIRSGYQRKFIAHPVSFINASGATTFRSYHNHSMPDSLLTEIATEMRKENYEYANKKLGELTRNSFGLYTFQNDNQLALYLQTLLVLDTNQNIDDLSPLVLASENGFKQAQLLLATISYLGLCSTVKIGKHETLLAKYDPSKDWTNKDLLNSVIESYLKELVETVGTNFSHYALGKLYIEMKQYERAMNHLSVAVDRNYKKAILEQGILLRTGSPDGIIPKNPVKSLEMLNQVNYNPIAHKILIEMFRNGEGLLGPSFWRAFCQTFKFLMFKLGRGTKDLSFALLFEMAAHSLYLLIFTMIILVASICLH